MNRRYYTYTMPKSRDCEYCEQGFAPKNHNQRFCNSVCRRNAGDAKHRHRMTIPNHREVLAAQDGCCTICSRQIRLFIDHDHRTGRFRSLLCHLCNAGLGFFQDDSARLRAAADYIDSFS